MQVLVVEDEVSEQKMLEVLLEELGFSVTFAANAYEAEYHANTMPDLALVDIVLEGTDTSCPDGLALVRKLRREGHTFPIIMISKTDLSAVKVLALRSGADDYITKPYVREEVAARIEAILRRQKARSRESAVLEIDFDTFSVRSQGRSVPLTAKEFRIMETLLSRPGVVVSRDMLVRRVWLNNDNVSNRVIDNHIGALRRKLEEVSEGAGHFLQTVHGIGYKLSIPGAESK